MGYGFGGCGKGCGLGDDNGIFFIVLIIILFCCCDGGFGGIGKGCGGDEGFIWIIVIIVLLCLCNPVSEDSSVWAAQRPAELRSASKKRWNLARKYTIKVLENGVDRYIRGCYYRGAASEEAAYCSLKSG